MAGACIWPKRILLFFTAPHGVCRKLCEAILRMEARVQARASYGIPSGIQCKFSKISKGAYMEWKSRRCNRWKDRRYNG